MITSRSGLELPGAVSPHASRSSPWRASRAAAHRPALRRAAPPASICPLRSSGPGASYPVQAQLSPDSNHGNGVQPENARPDTGLICSFEKSSIRWYPLHPPPLPTCHALSPSLDSRSPQRIPADVCIDRRRAEEPGERGRRRGLGLRSSFVGLGTESMSLAEGAWLLTGWRRNAPPQMEKTSIEHLSESQ